MVLYRVHVDNGSFSKRMMLFGDLLEAVGVEVERIDKMVAERGNRTTEKGRGLSNFDHHCPCHINNARGAHTNVLPHHPGRENGSSCSVQIFVDALAPSTMAEGDWGRLQELRTGSDKASCMLGCKVG